MARAKEKSGKGFGARYGPSVRVKYGRIARAQRSTYKCPYCSYDKVKRLAVGIWECKKCDSKFTNKAYKVEKVATIKNALNEESAEVTENE